ncbi:glycosyltransferase family 4 protein [Streptomyces sp. NPDC020800]|uniref:glycosyltransferase family 4 protein n=1 Tax=Streptomyces sp. NPDC020800 TaxID=3365092 RepID=UPI003798259F
MREHVYSRSRVMLMPSLYESWGRVAVEAFASGIPVIAHPTPGLVESLGEAGIFAYRDDLNAWTPRPDLPAGPGQLGPRLPQGQSPLHRTQRRPRPRPLVQRRRIPEQDQPPQRRAQARHRHARRRRRDEPQPRRRRRGCGSGKTHAPLTTLPSAAGPRLRSPGQRHRPAPQQPLEQRPALAAHLACGPVCVPCEPREISSICNVRTTRHAPGNPPRRFRARQCGRAPCGDCPGSERTDRSVHPHAALQLFRQRGELHRSSWRHHGQRVLLGWWGTWTQRWGRGRFRHRRHRRRAGGDPAGRCRPGRRPLRWGRHERPVQPAAGANASDRRRRRSVHVEYH